MNLVEKILEGDLQNDSPQVILFFGRDQKNEIKDQHIKEVSASWS